MATPTLSFYEQFMGNIGNANIDLTGDTLKVMLVNGYTYSAAHDELADVYGLEIAAGNGYDTGGLELTSVTFGWDAGEAGTILDADDPVWNASGGIIGPATGAIIYSSTSTDDKLICYLNFDASASATDGFDIRLALNAGGLLIAS